jgi:hypothetical protein
MIDCVLDQVPNARDSISIAADPHRGLGAAQRDILALRQRQGRREFRDLGTDRA